MKYLKLKYILSGLISFFMAFECSAAVNPAVSGPNVSPAPAIFPGGVCTFQFQLNNNGTTATSSSAVTVEISLSQLDFTNSTFNVATDIAQTAGNTPFTWSYNAGVKTLTATLNGTFEAFSGNTFQIKNLNVLAASDVSNPTIGANVNVVTPTVINSSVIDDNVNAYTYTAPAAILPIELLSFEALKGNSCEAKLAWASATESKFDYFQLEQSTDGKNFAQAGIVQKSKGSNSKYEQIAELRAPKGSNVYYRLKMVDLDRSVHYSKTLGLQSDCSKKSSILISPNPASNTILIKDFNSTGNLYIYDITGRLVLTAAISEDGNQQINVANLTSGTYLVQVTSNEGVFYSKLVKQ